MTNKFASAIDTVAKTVDMNQAQAGGQGGPGLDKLLPAGLHRARFISYVEVGKQSTTFQGAPKVEDQVILAFEFSGPRVEAAAKEAGVDYKPVVIELRPMNKSLNDKAKFYKAFQRLNHDGKATHMAQLLGNGYLIGVTHRAYKDRSGKDRIAVDLNKKGEPLDIRPPRVEDVDTGEFKAVSIDSATNELSCFLWANPDLEQWGSIFRDGEWPERKDEQGNVTAPAKSKNVLQALVKSAKNFKGSPAHSLLAAEGVSLDVPDADLPGQDEDDADDSTHAPGPSRSGPTGPASTPSGAAADDALNALGV